jgi:hypothetical protein
VIGRSGPTTYDLRLLRLAGLIRRPPHTNRYQLTPEGIRIAVFYTKIYNRLLVALTAPINSKPHRSYARPCAPLIATSTATPTVPASNPPPELDTTVKNLATKDR